MAYFKKRYLDDLVEADGSAAVRTVGGVYKFENTCIDATALGAVESRQMKALTQAFSANSQQITGLSAGTGSGHAVEYDQMYAAIQASAAGLDFKASCDVATTAVLGGAGGESGSAWTYNNSNGTLTAPANGTTTLDSVALVANDRVLVKNQSTASQNGIYYVSTAGAGGAATVLTRATDADTSAEFTANVFTFIEEGGTYADTSWVLTTNDAITLGSTNLTFTQFGAGSGLTGGISTGNALVAAAGLADNDFLRIDGTAIEGRSAAQVLSDIGAQATHQNLTDIAGLAVTDGGFIVGDGSNYVLESAGTARTSLGLGTAAVATVGVGTGNLFAAAAGIADDDFLRVDGSAVEGRSAAQVLSDIGAQASHANLADIAAITQADGAFIVSDGTDFVAESGATARTSLGLGTAAVATVGVSSGNVLPAASGIADNDFLKIDGSAVEGRSASEVLSDIGAQGAHANLTDLASLTHLTGTDTLVNYASFGGSGSDTINKAKIVLSSDSGLEVHDGKTAAADHVLAHALADLSDLAAYGGSNNTMFDSGYLAVIPQSSNSQVKLKWNHSSDRTGGAFYSTRYVPQATDAAVVLDDAIQSSGLDHNIILDSSDGNQTLSLLPTYNGFQETSDNVVGRTINVKNVGDANKVTVHADLADGGHYLDGTVNGTVELDPGDAITLVCYAYTSSDMYWAIL